MNEIWTVRTYIQYRTNGRCTCDLYYTDGRYERCTVGCIVRIANWACVHFKYFRTNDESRTLTNHNSNFMVDSNIDFEQNRHEISPNRAIYTNHVWKRSRSLTWVLKSMYHTQPDIAHLMLDASCTVRTNPSTWQGQRSC